MKFDDILTDLRNFHWLCVRFVDDFDVFTGVGVVNCSVTASSHRATIRLLSCVITTNVIV